MVAISGTPIWDPRNRACQRLEEPRLGLRAMGSGDPKIDNVHKRLLRTGEKQTKTTTRLLPWVWIEK